MRRSGAARARGREDRRVRDGDGRGRARAAAERAADVHVRARVPQLRAELVDFCRGDGAHVVLFRELVVDGGDRLDLRG